MLAGWKRPLNRLEGWERPNICPGPPRSAHSGVHWTVDIGQAMEEAQQQERWVSDAVLPYSKANNDKLSGKWFGRKSHLFAVDDGFRPPLQRQEDILPLNRLPRPNTSVMTNPYHPLSVIELTPINPKCITATNHTSISASKRFACSVEPDLVVNLKAVPHGPVSLRTGASCPHSGMQHLDITPRHKPVVQTAATAAHGAPFLGGVQQSPVIQLSPVLPEGSVSITPTVGYSTRIDPTPVQRESKLPQQSASNTHSVPQLHSEQSIQQFEYLSPQISVESGRTVAHGSISHNNLQLEEGRQAYSAPANTVSRLSSGATGERFFTSLDNNTPQASTSSIPSTSLYKHHADSQHSLHLDSSMPEISIPSIPSGITHTQDRPDSVQLQYSVPAASTQTARPSHALSGGAVQGGYAPRDIKQPQSSYSSRPTTQLSSLPDSDVLELIPNIQTSAHTNSRSVGVASEPTMRPRESKAPSASISVVPSSSLQHRQYHDNSGKLRAANTVSVTPVQSFTLTQHSRPEIVQQRERGAKSQTQSVEAKGFVPTFGLNTASVQMRHVK